jgi:2',3'-cyclic-nucleotide 2'-phosphodiesterase (5'-nucleotidase family)
MKKQSIPRPKLVTAPKPTFNQGIRSATLPSKRQITIIEMGGFHSAMIPVIRGEEKVGGAAYVADAVTQIRQKVEPILISNGDIFTGQTTAIESGGSLVIQFMNQLKFDAMTLGIHDFDEGQEVLAKRIAEAKFPMLAANLGCEKEECHISEADHILSSIKPYIILDRGMQTIAVLGLMKEDTQKFQIPANLEGLTFWPVRETVQHWIPAVLDECPNVIIIQYNKPSDAEDLAVNINEYVNERREKNEQQVLPYLMFIGGHSEEKPVYGPNYLIMQGTDRGQCLGIIKIKQEYKCNRVIPEYTKISDKWLTPDPKVSKIVKEIKRRIALQDMLLCNSKGILNRTKLNDGPLGILITEEMKRHAGADIAFVSSGTTKMDIRAGEIYASDIDQAIPFTDTIVLMELSGELVYQILEQSAKLESDSGGSGGKILQVAGIRFKYDLKREKGNRVIEMTINGEKVDKKRLYKAAVSKYLVDGGDGYTQFKEGKVFREVGELKTVIKDYLKGVGTLDIKRDMRIEYESQ